MRTHPHLFYLIRRRFVLVTVLLLGSLACGDATGLDPDDLAGSWTATAAVISNPADASQSMDLLALGVTISLTFERDGRASAVLGPDTESGTYSVSGGEITLVLSGDRSSGTIERRGNRLLITITHGVEWDFEESGIDVPATLSLTMRRVG